MILLTEENPESVCLKCGSHHLMPDLTVKLSVASHGVPAALLESKPGNAWRNPEYVISPFTATICGSCGYTEFYAEDFTKLWRVYNEQSR